MRIHRDTCASVLLGVLLAVAAGCLSLSRWVKTPQIPAAYQVEVAPFHILTDSPLRKHDPVVQELIRLDRLVGSTLRLPPCTRPIEIYIFADQDSYQRFMAYHYPELPARRAFFIAEGPREVVYTFHGERLGEDLRHEACHALVHATLNTIPLWLDEGLAEYFETPPGSNGLHRRHLRGLVAAAEGGWMPGLTRLESFTDVRQMDAADYREAWAWVYYLLHSLPDGPELLFDYLEQLRAGSSRPLSSLLFRSSPRSGAGMVEFLLALDDLPGAVVEQTIRKSAAEPFGVAHGSGQ